MASAAAQAEEFAAKIVNHKGDKNESCGGAEDPRQNPQRGIAGPMGKMVSHIIPGYVPLCVDQINGKGAGPGEGNEFSQQSARLQLREQKHMENGAEKVTGEHKLLHHPRREGIVQEDCFKSVRVHQPGDQIEEDDAAKADDRMNAAAQLRLFLESRRSDRE